MTAVSENDKMSFCYGCVTMDPDTSYWTKNITAPSDNYYTTMLNRKVSHEELKSMDLDMMPGFRIVWEYNTPLENWAKFKDDGMTKQFVR